MNHHDCGSHPLGQSTSQALLRGFAEESRDGPVINTCCHGDVDITWYVYIYMTLHMYTYTHLIISFSRFLCLKFRFCTKITMFAMGGSVASRMSLRMLLASHGIWHCSCEQRSREAKTTKTRIIIIIMFSNGTMRSWLKLVALYPLVDGFRPQTPLCVSWAESGIKDMAMYTFQ